MNRMREFFFVGMLLVVLTMTSVYHADDTWAAYSSQAVSEKNSLQGGSIELSVTPDSGNSSGDAIFTIGSSFVYAMVVKNEGKNALRYHIRPVSPDSDLCGTLMLSARLEGTVVYDGSLLDFSYAAIALEKGDGALWQFSFTVPEDASFDTSATCELGLRFESWQNYAFSLGMGWYDEVEVLLPQMSFDSEESNEEQQPEAVQEVVGPLVPPVENEESVKEPVQTESVILPESQTNSEVPHPDLEEEREEGSELGESGDN